MIRFRIIQEEEIIGGIARTCIFHETMKVYSASVPHSYTLGPRYDLRFLDSTGRVVVHGAGGIVHIIG